MTLSKEEFKVMAMLYVANIDGNIQMEEIKQLIMRSDQRTAILVGERFSKMNDAEIIECLRENKALYADNETNKQELMADIRAIIEADEKVSPIEGQICKAIERILA